MKQSISWWCYGGKGVDDETLLREAKRIGFSGVELIDESKFGLVHDAGLEIASHAGHATIESGLNDPANHDRIEREIIASLELATKHKIANLIVFSGNRRPGLSEEAGAEHTAAGLLRVAKAAEQANVPLILEFLNSKVDHKGYQADSTEWIANVLDAVGSPHVKCLYDIYHAQVMEGDLIRTIQSNSTSFGHYHTAGNPGRNDLDSLQEIQYSPIFQAIKATGYDAYIGHEFIAKGDVLPALAAAFELTAKAWG